MTVYRNEGRWETSNAVFADGMVTRYEKGLDPPPPEMRFVDYGLSVLRADRGHSRPSPPGSRQRPGRRLRRAQPERAPGRLRGDRALLRDRHALGPGRPRATPAGLSGRGAPPGVTAALRSGAATVPWSRTPRHCGQLPTCTKMWGEVPQQRGEADEVGRLVDPVDHAVPASAPTARAWSARATGTGRDRCPAGTSRAMTLLVRTTAVLSTPPSSGADRVRRDRRGSITGWWCAPVTSELGTVGRGVMADDRAVGVRAHRT